MAGKSVTEREALSETVNKLSSDRTGHYVFTLCTNATVRDGHHVNAAGAYSKLG